MNVEEFIKRFRELLYTEPGCDDPLTLYRLYELLGVVLAEYYEELYP